MSYNPTWGKLQLAQRLFGSLQAPAAQSERLMDRSGGVADLNDEALSQGAEGRLDVLHAG